MQGKDINLRLISIQIAFKARRPGEPTKAMNVERKESRLEEGALRHS